MDIIKSNTKIDFMGRRMVAIILSVIVIALSIGSLVSRGLNFGLDFTGGTLIEVSYPEAPELADVRATLADAGFDAAMVQNFGTARDILIRLPARDEEQASAKLSNEVMEALSSRVEGIELRRAEFVGPQIGRELAEQGGLALLYVLIGILLYVSFRFQWRFALGAVAALVHDLVITVGVLSILQVGFDLTVIAALLAVLGYSLNDTIVLFDRLRENFRNYRKGTAFDLTNLAINQMLSRTLMTSLTTLLVLAALFYFGGEIIHAFAFTLIIGVLVGTYSSIYIAGSAAVALGVSKQDLMPVQKDEQDDTKEDIPEGFIRRSSENQSG